MEQSTECQLKREWILDIKTVSEGNLHSEFWRIKSDRHKNQKLKIWLWSKENNIAATTLPVSIKLTRVAPRKLDSDDNLPMAFKYIKDYIADQILPGQAAGRADSDSRIKWEYAQEKGKPKQYAIKILFQRISFPES